MTSATLLRRGVVVLVTLVTLATTACGGGESEAAAAEIKDLGAAAVPAQLLDLTVISEDVSQLKGAKRPFVDAVGLYSVRTGELLQATLQVSRFTKAAEAEKSRFRQAVVGQIGSTTPQQFRMGERTVYLTTGRRQNVAVWFTGDYVFILSTREEFSRPRALLRAALEIDPS